MPTTDYREIPLTQGQVALISACDYEIIAPYSWIAYFERHAKSYYAYTKIGHKRVFMHNAIMPPPEGFQVDHWDHDTLNNRRENLRFGNKFQQAQNRRKRSDNTSGYKGVFWFKGPRKWGVITALNGQRKYLGLYPTKEDAAHAYDDFAREHFREFALLNFPHHPPQGPDLIINELK